MIAGRLFCAAGALLLAGCYHDTPIPVSEIAPGGNVRVQLAPPAALVVSEARGVRGSSVGARILGVTADSVSLLVRSATGDPGAGTRDLFQNVVIARRDLLSVQRHELDVRRTAAAGAGAAALAVAVAVASLRGSSGGSPPPEGGGSADARIPLFLLRFR